MINSILAQPDRPGPSLHSSSELGVRSSEEGISLSTFRVPHSAFRTLPPSTFRVPHSALRTLPPSAFRIPHSAFRISSFTLVEILVVLAVTAILLLIGMPAFEKMAKGQGVELAAREMVGKLKAVRAYAVTNRKTIALIMPMEGFPAADVPSEMMNRSYRAAVVEQNGADWDYLYWIPNESWSQLSVGTAFLEIDGDNGVATAASKLAPDNDDATDGSLTKVNHVDFSDAGGGASVDGVAAIIFRGSGQDVDIDAGSVVPVERFVEIGEGKYTGGTLIITNPDPAAYVTMKIDQYSGRVSYGKD